MVVNQNKMSYSIKLTIVVTFLFICCTTHILPWRQCYRDWDCQRSHQCLYGRCVRRHQNNNWCYPQCEFGRQCVNRVCVPNDRCAYTTCLPYQHCLNGFCYNYNKCRSDQNCQQNDACRNGACVSACSYVACREKQTCIHGDCIRTCFRESDCYFHERCHRNICRRRLL